MTIEEGKKGMERSAHEVQSEIPTIDEQTLSKAHAALHRAMEAVRAFRNGDKSKETWDQEVVTALTEAGRQIDHILALGKKTDDDSTLAQG